jgi:hypothetical protein
VFRALADAEPAGPEEGVLQQIDPVDSTPTTVTPKLASQSPSSTSPAALARNVLVSAWRPPWSPGTRTVAVTDALCTSSPAQRSISRDRARDRVVLEVQQVIRQASVGAAKLGHPVILTMGLALARKQLAERPRGAEAREVGGAQVRFQRHWKGDQGKPGGGGGQDLCRPSVELHVVVRLRPPGRQAGGGRPRPSPIAPPGTRR